MKYLKKQTEVEAVLAKPTINGLNEIIELLRIIDPNINGSISFNKAIGIGGKDFIVIDTPNYKAKLVLGDYIVMDLNSNKTSLYSKQVFDKNFYLDSKPSDKVYETKEIIANKLEEKYKLVSALSKLEKDLYGYQEIIKFRDTNILAKEYITDEDVKDIQAKLKDLDSKINNEYDNINSINKVLDGLNKWYKAEDELSEDYKISFSPNIVSEVTNDDKEDQMVEEMILQDMDTRLQDEED